MTQHNLISALEDLRERYTQRRKRVVALNEAAKAERTAQNNLHGARDKFQETLAQYLALYAEDVPTAFGTLEPMPPLPSVTWLLSDAQRNQLKSEINALDSLIKALKSAIDALSTEPLDVVRLAKANEALQATKLPVVELPQLLEQYTQVLQSATDHLSISFGTVLRDAFANEGLVLDGRPPIVQVGRFRVSLDFAKRRASLAYGKEVMVERMGLSAEAILKAYRSAYKALTERSDDGTKWLEQLYDAWRIVRFRQGSDKPDANLVACYIELALQRQATSFLRREPRKTLFKEYSRAQFAYDVDLFINRQRLSHKSLKPSLRVAVQAQTSSPERVMWIVSGETADDGSYMSTLTFDERG
ncbi:hypothetical protein FBQ95_00595 [Chloroflexi bacterium CFX3]|nr:hypothetical protein [Chloroflexi bacterium CFX3]